VAKTYVKFKVKNIQNKRVENTFIACYTWYIRLLYKNWGSVTRWPL